jgi:hypothetical protein
MFLAGILTILLIGLIARYIHLRSEHAERYEPEGLEEPVDPGH